jgi:hypothetical protein
MAFSRLHGIISEKIELFKTTAVENIKSYILGIVETHGTFLP